MSATLRPGRLGEPLVSDVMTTDVVSARTDTPVADVIAEMVRCGVGAMSVVNDQRRVVGIVTDTDVIVRKGFRPLPRMSSPLLDEFMRSHRNRWREKAGGLVAGEIMSSPTSLASPHEPLRDVVARMVTMGVRRLPVARADGRLVGIISQRDVLRLLCRDDTEIVAAIRLALADRGGLEAAREIEVTCTKGAVTLRGSIPTASDAEQIESIVRDVPGVLGVRNELRIASRVRSSAT